jgi:flagellar motor switch protein FliN/FliY
MNDLVPKNPSPDAESLVERLRFVMDVPQHLEVEVGRSEVPLKEVMSWKVGSLVDLDKVAGEPVDVYAGDRLIARGEVVVVNDHYGVRVTEITHPDSAKRR